ncbi:MAG: rRNA pseudouridine synthase [Candidatus Omnitrophica bacterium]|nr:rRNA pseudouridine synthase [Candidatus Omnitrophota bacterium]
MSDIIKIVKKPLGKVILERALSKLGFASRSQTRSWVLEGRLKVNGIVINDPLYLVVPEKDKFVLDGKLLQKSNWQTIILYKPKAVVTTRSDEQGRRTVFDLLPEELKQLHPVGRLDMATTGLLLLTNDSQLSSYLTDPVNAILRTYIVMVTGRVSPEKIQQASEGVWDNGEFLKASKLVLRKVSNKESHLIMELTEGKNREIRRLFKCLGHEVTRLKRVAFGPFTLGTMQPGEFRQLKHAEIQELYPVLS